MPIAGGVSGRMLGPDDVPCPPQHPQPAHGTRWHLIPPSFTQGRAGTAAPTMRAISLPHNTCRTSASHPRRACAARRSKFRDFMARPALRLPMRRIGLLLAAATALTGESACVSFCNECLGMVSAAGSSPHVSDAPIRGGVSTRTAAAAAALALLIAHPHPNPHGHLSTPGRPWLRLVADLARV